MKTFLLIDASHIFHRSKHACKGNDVDKAGFCLHLLFSCLGKAWRLHQCDHVVFAFDGHSWRKSIYPPYKRQRVEKLAKQTQEEKEEAQVFKEVFSVFKEFVISKTNCTILDSPILEADDLIATFIQLHPNDKHIIVSGDKDFEQLLSSNVSIYDGVKDQFVKIEGVFDYRNNPVIDKKTDKPIIPDPEWSLFEKIMRGCTSDNIFAASPSIRLKSSKTKVGLLECFEDRHKKGFAWSAVMMNRWVDHLGVEHKTFDDYNRNVILVDLTKQPEDIRALLNATVEEAAITKNVPMIGLHFLKFCGKYELVRLSEQATMFGNILSAKY